MEKSAFKQISGLINAAVIAHHSLLMEASGGSLSYEKIKEITDGLLNSSQVHFQIFQKMTGNDFSKVYLTATHRP